MILKRNVKEIRLFIVHNRESFNEVINAKKL